jgi:hypothetical protein
MNKQSARNVLVIIGAWSLSGTLAWAVTVLLIPIGNRLIYAGDSGTVIMRAWSAVPQALTAAAAAIAVMRLIETRRPWPWIGGLIALYVYTGVLTALSARSGFISSPTTPDYIGMAIEGIMPAIACAVATLWSARRRSPVTQSRS